MSCCYQFRVILIGDSTVGKTSLLHRLKWKTGQLPDVSMTIGVDFHTTTIQVNDKTVNLQLWDTAGQEDFRSITTSYFHNAVAGFLVFDITKRESFYHLNQWISEAKSNSHPEHDIVFLLVGNKADLMEEREVSQDEAKCFAVQHNMNYIETSARSGSNVQEASQKLTETLLLLIEGGELTEDRTWNGFHITTPSLCNSSAFSSVSISFAPAAESQISNDTSIKKNQGCCQK